MFKLYLKSLLIKSFYLAHRKVAQRTLLRPLQKTVLQKFNKIHEQWSSCCYGVGRLEHSETLQKPSGSHQSCGVQSWYSKRRLLRPGWQEHCACIWFLRIRLQRDKFVVYSRGIDCLLFDIWWMGEYAELTTLD